MPIMISNRIMFPCLYHIQRENGDFISIQSAKGNEYYYHKHAKVIGKDEVCNYIISMTKMSPLEDGSGVDVGQIICVDPQGMIPDFVKAKVAKAQAMNAFHMIEYLKHGTIPPQL